MANSGLDFYDVVSLKFPTFMEGNCSSVIPAGECADDTLVAGLLGVENGRALAFFGTASIGLTFFFLGTGGKRALKSSSKGVGSDFY